MKPVDNAIITTPFGIPDSYAKFGRHSGLDYGIPVNTVVKAPASGTLRNIVSPTGGNMVVINDGKYFHRLMHNNIFSRGDGPVNKGDEVARSGNTGLSTGPHLHWDINSEATYPTSFNAFIDPMGWLEGDEVTKEDLTKVYETIDATNKRIDAAINQLKELSDSLGRLYQIVDDHQKNHSAGNVMGTYNARITLGEKS
jgi:murein DD-endopeptidase MepM/ murein hydrolase activator NlpD